MRPKHTGLKCVLAVLAAAVIAIAPVLADTIQEDHPWSSFWRWFWIVIALTIPTLVAVVKLSGNSKKRPIK